LYKQIDEFFNQKTATNIGFEALLASAPYQLETKKVEQFAARYHVIKTFQQKTIDLFNASLRGDHDPEIAKTIFGDMPRHFGREYHVHLNEHQNRTPVFFRTDEPVCGKIAEIQCPGSGWCLAEQVRQIYCDNTGIFGNPTHFPQRIVDLFSHSLARYLGKDPIIHHLTENASRPHGMRFFIQLARDKGVKFYSYDQGITHYDCNFVRSHDFVSLLHHNFFSERLERCSKNQLWFDLSPSALFDGKIILAWPFWKLTRDAYPDAVREILPYTTVISPEGMELEDGSWVGIDDFCERPPKLRNYYVKYAGTDISLNWGSKGVYLASSGSKAQCKELMKGILKDWTMDRRWVLQSAYRLREKVGVLDREEHEYFLDGYAKYSGFYGPSGLLGIIVMHKNFQKVHGSAETVMSLVY
jgi:hypothetical protein